MAKSVNHWYDASASRWSHADYEFIHDHLYDMLVDVKVGDWVVTPWHGKPVEIQALGYNALRVMERLAHRFRLGVVDGAIHHRLLQGARSNPRESRAGEAMAYAVP
jgi:glycogen debranching enzyme